MLLNKLNNEVISINSLISWALKPIIAPLQSQVISLYICHNTPNAVYEPYTTALNTH